MLHGQRAGLQDVMGAGGQRARERDQKAEEVTQRVDGVEKSTRGRRPDRPKGYKLYVHERTIATELRGAHRPEAMETPRSET